MSNKPLTARVRYFTLNDYLKGDLQKFASYAMIGSHTISKISFEFESVAFFGSPCITCVKIYRLSSTRNPVMKCVSNVVTRRLPNNESKAALCPGYSYS